MRGMGDDPTPPERLGRAFPAPAPFPAPRPVPPPRPFPELTRYPAPSAIPPAADAAADTAPAAAADTAAAPAEAAPAPAGTAAARAPERPGTPPGPGPADEPATAAPPRPAPLVHPVEPVIVRPDPLPATRPTTQRSARPGKQTNPRTVAVALLVMLGGLAAGVTAMLTSPDPDEQEPPVSVADPVLPTDDETWDEATPVDAVAIRPDGTETFDTRGLEPGSALVLSTEDGVLVVTVHYFLTDEGACEESGAPPQRGMYLLADVTVEVFYGEGAADPLSFTWVADDGSRITSDTGMLAGCLPAFEAADLSEGDYRTGLVVFDVADTAGVLEYQYQVGAEPAASWRP